MTQSYFEDIDLHLTSALMQARLTVRAAVAWCTDPNIIRALAVLQKRGVSVELIVNDDKINRKIDYSSIISNGGKIYYAEGSADIMHNKFCVIDSVCVITGSYNWTSHAKANDEQISIISEDQEEVNKYNEKFEGLLYAIAELERQKIVTIGARKSHQSDCSNSGLYPKPFVNTMQGASKHCQALVDAATYTNMQMLKNVGAVPSNMSFGAMATQALQDWVDKRIKEWAKRQSK